MGLSTWNRLLNDCQFKNDYTQWPAGLKWRSNTFFLLSTVAMSLFTDLFLYALIVPVLPFMLEDRLGIPPERTQSYTSSMLAVYAASSMVFSPIAGVLADKMSTRQAPFLLGITALLGATVLLFFAQSIEVLVAARVVQGMSAAIVWSVGMALAIETVGADNLGKTFGTMFSVISVGSIWAPTVGGLLYEKAGYEGVIGVSLALIAVDFIMRLFGIEKKVARRYGLDDAKQDASHDPEFSPNGDTQHTASTDDERQPLLGRLEDDKDDDDGEFKLSDDQAWIAKAIPILPCLANPSLLTALYMALVQAISFGSFDATITTVSRELFGFDSLKAGLLFLPLGVMDVVLGPLAGWSVDRYGTKPASVLSYAWMVPVFISLRLPHAGGSDQVILYAVLLGFAGLGLSAQGATSVVEAGAVVRKYHERNPGFFGNNGPYAQLYGLTSMVYALGLTVGPELAGELKEAIGYGNMNIVLAAISAVTAVLSWMYVGNRR